MKHLILFISISLLLISCFDQNSKQVQKGEKNCKPQDTTLVKKDILGEVAGSAYLKRATGYCLVIREDTSDYRVVFSEAKERGKVSIDCKYDKYCKKGKSYKTRIEELEKILLRAKSDYNFDSLTTISIGRLVSTGDLAVAITNDYIARYGYNFDKPDYKKISAFLLDSELSRDFNELLKPYNRIVTQIECEKVFFTFRKDLYYSSIVETDSTLIPDRILDCITWIIAGPENK